MTHINKIKPEQVAGNDFDTDLLLDLELVHFTVQGVFLFEKNVSVMN